MAKSSKSKAKPKLHEDDLVIKTWSFSLPCRFCAEEIPVSNHGQEVRCTKCFRFFTVHTRRDRHDGPVTYRTLIPKRNDECFMCKLSVVIWKDEVGTCVHCKQEWKMVGKVMCPTNFKPPPDIAEFLERRKGWD